MQQTPSDQTNGHAKSEKPRPPNAILALRVFRVEANTNSILRMLSPEIGGCMTHYTRHGSQICRGANCPPSTHKCDQQWKGYVAAILWNVMRKKWRPVVLEITEYLEVEMRAIYGRGQEWELWKGVKKSDPVQGKLLGAIDLAAVPAAFPILPVLQIMYHCFDIDLSVKNPMPPRVIVSEIDGDEPDVCRQAEYSRDADERLDPRMAHLFNTDGSRKSFEQLQRERMNGRASPSEEKRR